MSQQKNTNYTGEELLDALRECDAKHGKVTKDVFESDDELPSVADVEAQSDNWSSAKEEAGVDRYTRKYSDEDLLQMLRDCKDEHGKCSPRLFDDMEDTCSSSQIMNRFDDPNDDRGGWKIAKEKAGVEEDLRSETGRKKKYSKSDILSHIRTCHETEVTDDDGNVRFEAGKCTVEKLQAMGDLVAPSVAVEEFESWSNAKEMAGVGSNERLNNARPREYTDEDYLWMLKACERLHGKVTQSVFNSEESLPSAGAVRKRFEDPDDERGGWAIAKAKAGIEDNTKKYTEEELIEMLQKFDEEHEGRTTASAFASDDSVCAPETVQRMFDDPDDERGGWMIGKEKAGIE